MRRLALVLLVLPLAACGGKSGAPGSNLTPVAYVQQSALKTAQASSEHVTFKATGTVSGTSLLISGSGDFDAKAHTGALKGDFSAAGLSGTVSEVTDGTTLYLSSPLFASVLPAGKTWLKVDLGKVSASQGVNLSSLIAQNPTGLLAQVKAIGNVTKVGSEQVDGVSTTHYRGHIDISKVPQGAKIQAVAKPKYGPYDVWIGDDDGYVHAVKLSYSVAPKGAQRQTIAMTMNFSGFGKDVSVTVPAASTVFDATNLSIKGLTGG